MKIFMGLNNIASLMSDYKEGFTALGHECFCVARTGTTIQSDVVDMFIPALVESVLRKKNDYSPATARAAREKFMALAWEKALEADVCFFIWESFKVDASDLAILKQMGKRIIVRLCGSEVRDPHVDAQYAAHYGLPSTEYGLKTNLETLRRKLRYLRQVERYADLVICGSAMSLRPVSWRGACLFSQQGLLRRSAPQRRIPVLLHAPSSRKTKGTDIWLAAFDMLRDAKVKFGVKMIENIPHADMLREYATADIACGSLYYGGRAMWESLAAGCVHLGVMSKEIFNNDDDDRHMLTALGKSATDANMAWLRDIRDHFSPTFDAPNVNVTAETLANTLTELILDLPRRQALADAGTAFMDRWFSPRQACQNILEACCEPQSLEQQADLFMPTFFRHHYLPPENDPERLSLFNSYTKLVSRCDWYKTFVPRGERAGLLF